ncbi:MAG: zinc transporter ZntB [Kangiellaceae bacterium]|nr:zinc transporter ZntB [Kangiellaceae bacterium]
MKKSIFISKQGAITDNQKNFYQWHHINYTHSDDVKWLHEQNIPSLAKDILLQVEHRPRYIQEEEDIILCLRGVNLNPEATPEDMITVRVYCANGVVITSCNRQSMSINDVNNLIELEKGPASPAKFVVALIDTLTQKIETFFEELESKLDLYEDNMDIHDFELTNKNLAKLRRQCATVKRYLAPQREALEKLYRSEISLFADQDVVELREIIDKFIRLIEDLELTRERTMLLREEFLARIAHEQNSRLYLLAIISVIFLPLTFLTGLLGMNVAGIPGTDYQSSFVIVSFICVAIGFACLFWFKRKRWF